MLFNMEIISKLKNWLIILPMIPVAVGGVSKGLDILKYDIVGLPKNSEERYIQHMVRSHFVEGENSKSTTIEMESGNKIIVQVFKDGCVTMKRISTDGLASGFKIIPEPGKENDLSKNENGIAYAGVPKVDLGVHRNDSNFRENMKNNNVIRIYNDGCVLVGYMGKLGNIDRWEWVKYNH